ncbi:C40 family peptidase [Streptomyces sclerotialus]|uniref:C40 family peptidase n=1 Tax=Streptomyces sclerotialus TaxID=1957 RepID=UPI0004C729AC
MTARDHHPALGVPALASRAAAVSVLTLALVGGVGPAPGGTPDAAAASASGAGKTALRVAASKAGAPYQWGATGPHRFDCSGLTQYAFKRAGKRLPRTAHAQYRHVRHIKKSSRKRGDLVFFHGGGTVYHVGIYAGEGRMWNAPKPGASVRTDRIWSRAVSYGRP